MIQIKEWTGLGVAECDAVVDSSTCSGSPDSRIRARKDADRAFFTPRIKKRFIPFGSHNTYGTELSDFLSRFTILYIKIL